MEYRFKTIYYTIFSQTTTKEALTKVFSFWELLTTTNGFITEVKMKNFSDENCETTDFHQWAIKFHGFMVKLISLRDLLKWNERIFEKI